MRAATASFVRLTCPCCGYATLPARNVYNVCKLCNWEDDGRGEHEADAVLPGRNGALSLVEARANFKSYRVMYAPGRHGRMLGAASQLEYDTKGRLMIELKRLQNCPRSQMDQVKAEIAGLERTLYEEALRRVLEFDGACLGVAQPSSRNRAAADVSMPLRAPVRWMCTLRKVVRACVLGNRQAR